MEHILIFFTFLNTFCDTRKFALPEFTLLSGSHGEGISS